MALGLYTLLNTDRILSALSFSPLKIFTAAPLRFNGPFQQRSREAAGEENVRKGPWRWDLGNPPVLCDAAALRQKEPPQTGTGAQTALPSHPCVSSLYFTSNFRIKCGKPVWSTEILHE